MLQVCHGKCQHSIESNTGKYPILATSGEIGRTDSYLYDKPSVLIGRKGTIDKPQYIDSPFWTIDTLFYTKIAEGYNPKFLYYLCLTIDWASMNEASGVPSLSANRIESLEVTIPGVDEQDKISNALSSIDKHVSTLDALIAKYEAIKKATVNLLLKPKAGWKRVKLGDVFEVKVGGDLDVPHYSPYKTIDCRYEIVSNSLTNHGHYGYTSLPNFPGDSITVTGRGNVGHAEYRQEPFDAIVRTVILSPNCAQVCSKFVAELINATDTFLIENTGVPQLTAPQIASTSITLPPLDEQKRIVEILDSLDGTISGLRSQLAKAQDIKRGMMAYFFG